MHHPAFLALLMGSSQGAMMRVSTHRNASCTCMYLVMRESGMASGSYSSQCQGRGTPQPYVCLRIAASAHYLSSAYHCSTVGNEDFRDVSLETQDGKPVLMNDTDREALVMGMTLHDKAQQFLQKVSTHLSSHGSQTCSSRQHHPALQALDMIAISEYCLL